LSKELNPRSRLLLLIELANVDEFEEEDRYPCRRDRRDLALSSTWAVIQGKKRID
jgi:hypothetical protein